MRLLFLHSNTPDYLSAGLFHGLRTILGKDCLDLPRFDCMYKPLADQMRSKIRGNAFTLYGLLDDDPDMVNERFFIWHKNISDFDFYIIADIWNSWETYLKLSRSVTPEKIIIVDPSDKFRFYPFNNYKANNTLIILQYFFFNKKSTKYFKRELSSSIKERTGLFFLPKFIQKWLLPKKVYTISFSIPSDKIKVVELSKKIKEFTSNNVDIELQNDFPELKLIPLGIESYLFTNEEQYYLDIQKSKFGITTKRSGWDCLRHYEYAANGAVLCFKYLKSKPVDCAPHGLNHSNCIFYSTPNDLKQQITNLTVEEYNNLLFNSYKWISDNTTVKIAQRFIHDIIND